MKFIDMINKKHRVLMAIIFLVMTIVGLAVTPDYGIPWDELLELRALGTNVREYTGLIVGQENEPEQSSTGIIFPDILEHTDNDHGESVYYLLAPVLFADLGPDAPHTFMLIFHAYIFLLFMFGVVGIYFICSFLTKDWKYGLLASLFLYLSPRFFGESHYNSKDIIAMSLIILSFWFFIKFNETRQIRFLLIFSIVSAVASNMRIVGFVFFGLAGILYLIILTIRKEWNRLNFLLVIFAAFIFLISYFAITPASWTNPVLYASYVFGRSSNFTEWGGFVYYLGSVCRPVPWHYIPVMFAVTTPILIVVLTFVGNAVVIITSLRMKISEIIGGTTKYYLMTITFIWIFLGYAMIRQPILFNGWRHFYFLYGLFLVLAVFAVKWIVDSLKKNGRKIIIGIVVLHFFLVTFSIGSNHPYEANYYNYLAGMNPSSHFEMDYWNVTMMKALVELVDTVDSEEIITVTTAENYSINGLYNAYYILPESYRNRLQIKTSLEDGSENDADYLIVNPIVYAITKDKSNADVQKWLPISDPDNQIPFYPETVVLRAYGSDVMIIYKLP